MSGSEVGQRGRQHRAVVEAARKARVGLIAYTSILHADTTPLALAAEHQETEAALRASGLPTVLLRNGWYTENYTERQLGPALDHGVLLGAAGEGRIAAAARADYAAAAVAVLTGAGHEGMAYELGGDQPFTLAEFAAEVSRQSGKPIVYRNLPADEYAAALRAAGLPPPVAALFADVDVGIARGALDDRSGTLRSLIGRPTTPLARSVAEALGRRP